MATATGNFGPTIDLWDAFTTSQIFHTRDELVCWVREVGKTHGVIINIRRSETTHGGKGTHNKIIFKCKRHGTYKHVVDVGCSSRRRSSEKCNCPFELKAKPLSPPFNDWTIKVRCGIHNHGPNKSLVGSFFGRFMKEEVAQAGEHLLLNVKAQKSLNAMKDRNPFNLSSIKQLYRLRVRLRKAKRGSRTEIQHLMTQIEEYRYLCWSRKLEGTNIVEEIMWANQESIKLLRMFPQVLIMDCTFKTNKYFLPLLEIVGVTSTNFSFSIAFAYLSHERYGDYTWALQNLRELMSCDIELPKVILTDKEDALMRAVAHVFPEATNLLCQYHINKNVEARLKKTYKGDRRKNTMALWKNVVDTSTETEYNEAWSDFQHSTSDKPHIAKYIWDTWLKDHKERFCGPWTDRVRHLGNTTTNRVESMHWSLKKALGQSGGDLCGVWEQMHGMIRGQLGKIIVSFQESVNRVDAHHNKPFYQPLWGQVSRHALELLHDEWTRCEEFVGTNDQLCGCVIRTTHGLPCACNLGVLHTNILPITLDMIDSHWKRLSMECLDEERMKEASHDCDLTYTIEEVYRKWGSFNLEEKCVWKRGLDDYVFKETTNMVPPLHKVKTRGAPKKDKKRKKNEYDARRDPSHWEHVDRMDEAEDEMLLSTLKSSLKSKKKSTQRSTQRSTKNTPQESTKKTPQESTKELANVFKKAFKSQEHNPDMKYALEFPHQIQRYIDSIINVDGDGNCGFRCIAGLMCWGQESWNKVRLDLGEEMDMNYSLYTDVMGDRVNEVRESLIALPNVTFQPVEKWMSMPDLGHVIATTYQVALVMLSPASSTCFTFLPLRGEYRPSQSRLLTVGFVGKNHWVQVRLKHTSPMPPIHPSWGAYCSGETHSWYTPYMGRLQLWENIFQSHSQRQPNSSFALFADYIDITEM